jgi:hypothetical protein
MRSLVGQLTGLASRNRSALAVGLVIALLSSGTAAAVSVVLGGVNTSSNLTTFKSGRNGAVLQVSNTNSSGGAGAKGLGITVPAGRAPITVNANAGKATNLNADRLDGLDASAFLPTSGQAADSQALDGIDSTGFVRGNGVMRHAAVALPPFGANPHGEFFLGYSFVDLHVPSPHIGLYYGCPNSQLTTNGYVSVRNEGSETVNVFVDNGQLDPIFFQLSPDGSQHDVPTLAAGEHLSIQVQGAGMVTFEVYSKHRANDCHVQGQAWFAY